MKWNLVVTYKLDEKELSTTSSRSIHTVQHTQVHNFLKLAAFEDVDEMIQSVIVGPFARLAAEGVHCRHDGFAVLGDVHLDVFHLYIET